MQSFSESHSTSVAEPKRNRSMLWACLAVSLAVGLGVAWFRTDLVLSDTKDELSRSRIAVNELRQERSGFAGRVSALKDEIGTTQAAFEEAQHLNRKYRSQLAEAKRELSELRQDKIETNVQAADLLAQNDELKERLIKARAVVPTVNYELQKRYENEIESLKQKLLVLQEVVQYMESSEAVTKNELASTLFSAHVVKTDLKNGLIVFDCSQNEHVIPNMEFDVANENGECMRVNIARVEDNYSLAHIQPANNIPNFKDGEIVQIRKIVN